MPLPKSKERYTYQDYLTWDDGERWEIIDGELYNMTPAPGTWHQIIVGRLYSRLEQALGDKRCLPFISPIDVVLSDHDVVQPDVIVVCDPKKITEKNIQGTPDLVVEVLSPSTSLKDRREKKNLYERFGVKEYLLVDPQGLLVEVYRLEANNQYGKSEIFGADETLKFHSLAPLELSLREILETQAPRRED